MAVGPPFVVTITPGVPRPGLCEVCAAEILAVRLYMSCAAGAPAAFDDLVLDADTAERHSCTRFLGR